MSLQDIQEHVRDNVRLNTEMFGETVAYRYAAGGNASIAVHGVYDSEPVHGADGTELVETFTVEISREGIKRRPELGDRMYRANEDKPYLFIRHGKSNAVSYKAVFERTTLIARGRTL